MKPMHLSRRPALLLALALATTPAWALDPHAGHGAADPMDHSQHDLPAEPRDDGGHDTHDAHDAHDAHQGHAKPPLAPGAAAAGGVFPAPSAEEVRAAFPELGAHAHMKAPLYTTVLVDRLEAQDADAATALVWEARASVGDEFDRLVFTSEGERLQGDTEEARHEAYWRHAFSRWWESRLGWRHDAGEGPGRDWLGIGIEGLAPYFVELSATAYGGEEGRSAFSLEAEYDMRITNRLILQPRLELNAYGKDDAEKGLASGLADTELGLRLRYEVRREFAPYLGVEWTRLHGATADAVRAGGGRRGEARAVAGLRLWY